LFLRNIVTLVNFTSIHTAVAAQTFSHIDAGPPDAVGAGLHRQSFIRADTDATAAAFTFLAVKIIGCNQSVNMRFFPSYSPLFVHLYYSKNIQIKPLQKQQNGLSHMRQAVLSG
jgi:hypothetical protein